MRLLRAALAAFLLIAGPAAAQVKISGLPAATTPLAGTELVPIVQSATTKNVSVANVARSLLGLSNTWTSAQTFSVAPAFGDAAGTRTALGLGTAASPSFAGLTLSGISGSAQCLHVNSSGAVSGVGADCGAGGGTVTTSGTPAAGNLAAFSGATAITSSNLSGDCTTAGALAVTCTKLNGISPGAFFSGTDAANLTGTVSVARFNTGTGASSSTFLRGDGTWATPAGGGNISNSGTPTVGALTKWASSTTLVNADLSGDCTTAGATAITCTKTGGVAFAASATTDTTNAANIGSGTLAAARGGAGTVSGVMKANGSGVVSAATVGTDYAVPGSPATWTATQTFAGSASGSLASVQTNIAEPVTVAATAATGTISYDVTTQSVLYYTTNASANWTLNIRGNATTALNTLLATGQSVTLTHLVTQGATPFYNTAVQVDGTTTGVTTKWQGGAPASGNASGIDVYTYTVIKTGAATFTVLASQTPFL